MSNSGDGSAGSSRSRIGVRADGVAPTFEKARSEFEAAWADILPSCTDADFAEHRYQRAATAWPDGSSRCFCGAVIDRSTMDSHVFTAHMQDRIDDIT